MPFAFRSSLILAFLCTTASAAEGLRFNSPDVLNLSIRPAADVAGREVPIVGMSLSDAATIRGAPERGDRADRLAFSAAVFHCSDDDRACVKRHEEALIAGEGKSVRRARGRLTIVPESAQPVTFVDTKVAATKIADGDATRHIYLGRIPGSGYHRIEVQFDHDSPGSFLVAGNSGKAAFVHNTDDVSALSSNGERLVVFNPDDLPLALTVAQLGAVPVVEMHCTAKPTVRASFGGWQGDAFDLTLTYGQLIYPMRLARNETGWTVVAEQGIIAATSFACREPS